MGRIIGEWVRWNRSRRIIKAATSRTTVAASAATKATSVATTTTKATTTGRVTATTKATAETTAATGEARPRKAVFPDLEHSALPVVTVELLDGVACIIGAFERYDTGTLWAATRINVNVGTNNGSLLCCSPNTVNT